MKRVIFTEILLVIMLFGLIWFLIGDEPADVELSVIEKALLEKLEVAEVEKCSDMKLKRNYGINSADVREYLYYGPDNTMAVDELLILKLSDGQSSESFVEAINKRIDNQKKAFDGYGIDQSDILSRAKIYHYGNYVYLIVGRTSGDWNDIILKAMEG